MRQTKLFAAVAMAAPWLLLSAYAGLRSWLHWQTMHPFGPAGFCGSQTLAHCAWCGVAVVGLALALTSFALTVRPALRLRPSKVRR